MTTLDYGEIPTDLTIDKPYDMWLNAPDETVICAAINQGIDSCLEAVHFDDHGRDDPHGAPQRHITIRDSASMRRLLCRLMESCDDNANDLAADIMGTLGYEWI